MIERCGFEKIVALKRAPTGTEGTLAITLLELETECREHLRHANQ